MATEQNIVIGIFEDRRIVVNIIDELLKAGFDQEQLGFAAKSRPEQVEQVQRHTHGSNAITRSIVGGLLGAADLLLVPITGPVDATEFLASTLPITDEAIDHLPHAGRRKHPGSGKQADEENPPETEGKQAEQETTTGLTGGIIGGTLGAIGAAFFLPEIGPFVAGGFIAAILGGGAIGSVAGSLIGIFSKVGVPKDDISRYEEEIKTGNTIVTVKTKDEKQKAVDILKRYGAKYITVH